MPIEQIQSLEVHFHEYYLPLKEDTYRNIFDLENPRHRSIFDFSEALRAAKFRSSREALEPWLQGFVGQLASLVRLQTTVDAIVPIPSSHSLVEWIALNLFRHTGLPVLNCLEEAPSPWGASFRLRASVSLPRTVVVCDDVITSGTTMQSALSVLTGCRRAVPAALGRTRRDLTNIT